MLDNRFRRKDKHFLSYILRFPVKMKKQTKKHPKCLIVSANMRTFAVSNKYDYEINISNTKRL